MPEQFFANLPLSRLVADPGQPRIEMERPNYGGGDANTLQGLANSIREVGVLQPVRVVVMDGDDESRRYRIVSGQRRVQAAQMAGLSNIPCLVADAEADVSKTLVVQITENLQRKAMTTTELALAVKNLVQAGSTQEEVAIKLGIQASQISVLLKLLVLDPLVKAAFDSGRIESPRAAYDLDKLPPSIQRALIERAESRSQIVTQRDVREAKLQMAKVVAVTRHPYEAPVLGRGEYQAILACLEDGIVDQYHPEPHRDAVFGADWVGVERRLQTRQLAAVQDDGAVESETPVLEHEPVRVPSFTLSKTQVHRLYSLLGEELPGGGAPLLGKALVKRLGEL